MKITLSTRHHHPHAHHKTKRIRGIDIDTNILPLIKQIWKREVKTFSSCQGSFRKPAYVIILTKDFNKIKDLLPKEARIKKGKEGYAIESSDKKYINYDDAKFTYIYWRNFKRN